MSLSSILNIARSALMMQQWAMNVTSNNIANAQTPGYSRQRLLFQPGMYGGVSGIGAGGGFLSAHLTRVRDSFLDSAYRRESGFLGMASTTRYFLENVEKAVNEPSDSGVSAALDDLFRSFGDLAEDPTGSVSREEVRHAAERFIQRLRHLDAALDAAATEAADRLQQGIEQLNSISEKIASLNEKILASSSSAGGDPELLDQRDQLVDQLAGMLPIQVSQADNGSLVVKTGGITLVSGSSHEKLLVARDGNAVTLSTGSGAEALDPQGGSLKALMDLTTQTLPDYRRQLDALARSVVTEVNALHRNGTTAAGETGVDFFDPDGVTAGTISLSDAVLASTDAIAAAAGTEAGDNSVARQLAELGEKKIDDLDGRTFTGYYAGFAASLGSSVRGARQDEAAARSLADGAQASRESVSGVSIEEEMVTLIGQQEAYTAAARLVGVADQMVQEILRIVG